VSAVGGTGRRRGYWPSGPAGSTDAGSSIQSAFVGLLPLLLLIVLLVAVFGIGSVLEAAFWVLLIIAAVVVVLVFLTARAIKDRV